MLQRKTKAVFDLRFTTATVDEIATETAAPRNDGICRRIYTANVDHIVKLRRDETFRRAYAGAWLVTADGTPVWLYARRRSGQPIHRVTGADLLPALIERMDPALVRPAFLCGTEALATAIRADLVKRGHADEQILTAVPPFGFDADETRSIALAQAVAAHRTTHLFLGVGAPRSEIWAWRWEKLLGGCYVYPVGAAIAFHVGQQERAPRLVRNSGMEWAWRLAQEPRRLAKRYLVDSWSFLAAIGTDLRRNSQDS